jgi:hypothetical protein
MLMLFRPILFERNLLIVEKRVPFFRAQFVSFHG